MAVKIQAEFSWVVTPCSVVIGYCFRTLVSCHNTSQCYNPRELNL